MTVLYNMKEDKLWKERVKAGGIVVCDHVCEKLKTFNFGKS